MAAAGGRRWSGALRCGVHVASQGSVRLRWWNGRAFVAAGRRQRAAKIAALREPCEPCEVVIVAEAGGNDARTERELRAFSTRCSFV